MLLYEIAKEPSREIADANQERRYYHMIPNILDDELDAATYRVYGHIRRVAGEAGVFWAGTREIAKTCRLSLSAVTKAKRELLKLGYITIRTEIRQSDRRLAEHIRITDIWADNEARYSTTNALPDNERVPPEERVSYRTTNATVVSVGTTKKNPEKNTEKNTTHTGGSPKITKSLDAVVLGLISKYAERWTEQDVRAHIEDALNHKASKKWVDQAIGITRWLAKDAKYEDEHKSQTNGTNYRPKRTTQAIPEPEMSEDERERQERRRQLAERFWKPDDNATRRDADAWPASPPIEDQGHTGVPDLSNGGRGNIPRGSQARSETDVDDHSSYRDPGGQDGAGNGSAAGRDKSPRAAPIRPPQRPGGPYQG